MKKINLRLFDGENEIFCNILGFHFKQKEHEFARVGIAVPVGHLIIPDKLQIVNIFNGKFIYSVQEKGYNWWIFMARPDDSPAAANSLLTCDPWSLEIYGLEKNAKHLIKLKHCEDFTQTIDDFLPKVLRISVENYTSCEREVSFKQNILIKKSDTLKENNNLLKFFKTLKKKVDRMEIIEAGDVYQIELQYVLSMKKVYNLSHNIYIKNPQANGIEFLSKDLSPDDLVKKIERISAFLRTSIKTSLNLSLKIGYTTQIHYRKTPIEGQIIFIEHFVSAEDSYSLVQILHSPYKQMSLSKETIKTTKIKEQSVSLLTNVNKSIQYTTKEVFLLPEDIGNIEILPPSLTTFFELLSEQEFS